MDNNKNHKNKAIDIAVYVAMMKAKLKNLFSRQSLITTIPLVLGLGIALFTIYWAGEK